MPRRGVEALIRSTAHTNAIATRPTLPPLPARVLPNALLLVPFLFSRPQGLLHELCMHPPPLRVFMLQRAVCTGRMSGPYGLFRLRRAGSDNSLKVRQRHNVGKEKVSTLRMEFIRDLDGWI